MTSFSFANIHISLGRMTFQERKHISNPAIDGRNINDNKQTFIYIIVNTFIYLRKALIAQSRCYFV